MIEDCFYENSNSEIVDFAVGVGAGYINIKGIFRIEKTSKVARMSEIAEDIRILKKQEEKANE